jgi:hypothetical protein
MFGIGAVSDDPVVERIRKVRHQISGECGHDPRRLAEYYMKLQEQNRRRFYKREARRADRRAA